MSVPEPNSVAVKIQTGDPEFLRVLGLTKKQAKRAFNRWQTTCRIDAWHMERWYAEVTSMPGEKGFGEDDVG